MAAARKGRRANAVRFYDEALSEAERLDLESAREMEGLDEEIALLRLQLKRALEDDPQNLQLMIKGMELLVRAVSARYRLSQEAQKDLSDSIVGVIEGIGTQLFPEGFASAQGN